MSAVTDDDRAAAMNAWQGALHSYSDNGYSVEFASQEALSEAVAAALAAEREKARAPFLALADELTLEASEQDPWDGNCVAAYEDIRDRIRRAAEDGQ